MKKETLERVFSCELFENVRKTFFTEHLWTTASMLSKRQERFDCTHKDL